jgi:hypothetical protein
MEASNTEIPHHALVFSGTYMHPSMRRRTL